MTDDDVELLQQLIAHGGTQAFELVPLVLKKVIAERQWQKCKDRRGNEFKSFEAFVRDKEGLASTIEDLRAYCRKSPDVDRLILEAMEPGREHGGDRQSASFQGDNVTLKRGNSALYTLKRLKRDHPELFQQFLGGAISANAAAIEAGFRKKVSRLDQVRRLLAKMTAAERRIICEELQATDPGSANRADDEIAPMHGGPENVGIDSLLESGERSRNANRPFFLGGSNASKIVRRDPDPTRRQRGA